MKCAFSLPEETVEKIKSVAEAENRTRSAVVKMALRAWFSANQGNRQG